MRDERLHAQLADRHLLPLREAVRRAHHETQVVDVDHVRLQPVVLRIVADHTQLQIAVDQLRWDAARQRPPYLHLHLGILPPVVDDVVHQVQRRGFIGPDHQPARGHVAQLRERILQLVLQVVEAPAVLQHQPPGIGQNQLPPGPVDQLLAQFPFQPLHRQRNRRLRP